jgi:hypothetical protein
MDSIVPCRLKFGKLNTLHYSIPIPLVAQGHEKIYERFLKGKLIYKPNPNSYKGQAELPISALANPLEGVFDLSKCGDTGQFLSISTGYRKEKKRKNARKVEIWFTPRFLVEKELNTTTGHFKTLIPANWPETAQIGIFWTRGDWDNLDCYDHLTNQNMDALGGNDLYQQWRNSHAMWMAFTYRDWRSALQLKRILTRFTFCL